MNQFHRYRDRREAGRVLAVHLLQHCEHGAAAVLALPRGGVPVALEVARGLESPLDVLFVENLRAPAHPEFAMGAIGSSGFEKLNRPVIERLGLSRLQFAALADRQRGELARREAFYQMDRSPPSLHDRTTILVDDGLVDSSTMLAAVLAARERGATRIIVATPVGAAEACADVRSEVDVLVCPLRPDPLYSVGYWYEDFRPATDEQLRQYLTEATDWAHATAANSRTH
jgi:putative phosphoribosyl transferase